MSGGEFVPPALPARFELQGILGRGGHGEVYAALDKESGRSVAIKCLLRPNEEASGRLLREAHAAARITHPNVVSVLDVDVLDNGAPFLVMERLGGASLAEVLAFQERLSAATAAAILCEAAHALAEAHRLGVVHRDLKPGNVLIDAQWIAKVADFGNVRDDSQVIYEREGEIAGTPPYMAPEIVTVHKYEPAVDVWAFGCILSHMGSGKVPYQHLNLKSQKEVMSVIKTGKVSPLEMLLKTSSTPAEIVSIAKECCLPNPKERPEFESIAARLKAMIKDDWDPRPVARIKNKKIDLKGGATSGGGATSANVPTCMHSTYRDKFREKGSSSNRSKAETQGESGAPARQPQGYTDTLDQFGAWSLLKTFSDAMSPKSNANETSDNSSRI